MSETMRASVLWDARRMEIRDVPCPRPQPREVLLAVSAVGLCGTDFHIYSGEANYHLDASGRPVPLRMHPQILGHEVTGTVLEVGSQVGDLEPGARVVLDQGRNCVSQGRAARCEYCASGNSHQCEAYAEHGITGLPGGLAEYLAIPAVNAVRVESDLDPASAAVTEPLACVLHAADMLERASARYALAAPEPGRRVRNVLICGAGPSGLLFLQLLRRELGFQGTVLVSEPDAHKRQLAASYGAEVIDPMATDLAQAVLEHTDGRCVELLVEASGSGPLFEQVPGLIRRQATVVLYGHGHAGVGLEALNAVQWREPVLLCPIGASGGFDPDGRPSVYRRALTLIEEGRIDVRPLLSHRYAGLESVPQAFSGEHREPGYVKGVTLL